MSESDRRTELLPADALKGKRLGISISDSPDLDHLGLTEMHFRMTLGELARTVMIAGGELYYGGHLHPEGLTAFLINELERYGRKDRPLKVCLAWTVHCQMTAAQIEEQVDYLGLYGEIHFLDPDGERIECKADQPKNENDFAPEERAQALTSLRNYMTDNTDARIVVGGKRAGFEGAMPGILEEVGLSIESRQPLFLAGGFGGAAIDAIRTLRSEHAEWFPEDAFGTEVDSRLQDGIRNIAKLASEANWDGFQNGLSNEENGVLAASYRPSEIAALVGKGLGNLLIE